MKQIFSIATFLITSTFLFAQNELKSSDISKYAQTLEISNNQLIGEGANTLIKRISESQFLLLGEQHYSPEISELTNGLFPILSKNDFKNFVIELGPNSSEKMIDELKTKNSLYDFNNNFYQDYSDIPLPFFDGKKDELFLKTAVGLGFSIWAIDQEFLSSQLFLVDEIYELSNDKKIVETTYKKVKQYLQSEFIKYNKQSDYPMFTNMLQSQILKTLFEQSNTAKQQRIISDLKTSWKIYALNETKEYRANNFTRMKYMKRNFGEHYKLAKKADSLPKVFVKMGATHLANGKTWLGIYDLGTMIKELSYFNGTTSTSINCFSRYSEDVDGKVSDYLSEDGGEDFRPILELAEKDKWVLIETKPILEIVKDRKIKLNNNLRTLISGYDFILFSPIRTQVELNYTEKTNDNN